MNEQIRQVIDEIESCFKNEDGSIKLAALVPLGKMVRLLQAFSALPSATVKESLTTEPSEDAKRILNQPPERIYLQVGDMESEFPGEIHWRDVTWNEDRIERTDLVYVREDLAAKPAEDNYTADELDERKEK